MRPDPRVLLTDIDRAGFGRFAGMSKGVLKNGPWMERALNVPIRYPET